MLTGNYINKTEMLLILKSRLAKMYLLFNNDLQQDANECLSLIYKTMERATSIPIANYIKYCNF